jgi:2-methylisocitrate lyase-like PEP mutase family enzyme
MTGPIDNTRHFMALHEQPRPLLLANAWDAGSAKLLSWLGFPALATTSSGFAASMGRRDYGITREQALEHCQALVDATELPVSADLENGFADSGQDVAETVRLAHEVGLAGCSIEDWNPSERRIYGLEEAAERVAAAADAAHAAEGGLVLTARAENYLRGKPDLADTIARLQAFEQAGADVLYAPLLDRPEELRELLQSVGRPVNVLARAGAPPVSELAALGVKRVSVGGSFAFAAYGSLLAAARELLDEGTYGFSELAGRGAQAARDAFA